MATITLVESMSTPLKMSTTVTPMLALKANIAMLTVMGKTLQPRSESRMRLLSKISLLTKRDIKRKLISALKNTTLAIIMVMGMKTMVMTTATLMWMLLSCTF